MRFNRATDCYNSPSMLKKLRQSDIRRMVVAALFMPLMLFSFFSVSTMPTFSKGGIEIVICSGDSFKTIILDQHGQPVEEDRRTPCDWSMQAQATTVSAIALPPARAEYNNWIPGHRETALLSRAIHDSHHARAPPLPV